MTSHFGLELLTEHYRGVVSRKSDGLVLFFHWKLLTCDLKCVGNGEHFGGDQEIFPTELLPSGWSENGEKYTLKYRHTKTQAAKYVFKCVRTDKEDASSPLEISLVRISDEESRSLTVQPDDIDDNFSPKDVDALSKEIDEKVLKPLLPQEEKPRSTLLVSEHRPAAPQQPRPHQPPISPPHGIGPVFPHDDPFSGIGSSDLDPFGRIGSGGMLADPFQPRGGGGLPGPRFDPPGAGFLPGGGGRGRGQGGPRGRGGRRNFGDDLPPPGYDDMFM